MTTIPIHSILHTTLKGRMESAFPIHCNKWKRQEAHLQSIQEITTKCVPWILIPAKQLTWPSCFSCMFSPSCGITYEQQYTKQLCIHSKILWMIPAILKPSYITANQHYVIWNRMHSGYYTDVRKACIRVVSINGSEADN